MKRNKFPQSHKLAWLLTGASNMGERQKKMNSSLVSEKQFCVGGKEKIFKLLNTETFFEDTNVDLIIER